MGIVQLTNNGYEGVVIGISDSVSESQFPDLLDQIQSTFNKSSSKIYTAFRRRAFFRHITIIIPRSWKNSIKYKPATKQSFHTADFRIEHTKASSNEKCSDRAMVRTIGAYQCGEPNDYVLLTPNSFCPSNWASRFLDKNIVRQWARYRYGIYDEESKGTKLTYLNSQTSQYEPVKCSSSLKVDIVRGFNTKCSINPNSGSVHFLCRPRVGRPPIAAGSIMYEYRMDGLEHFCDDGGADEQNAMTRHNSLPPTSQNINCDGESTWTVIKRHQDFTNQNRPARIKNTAPIFRFVKAMPVRIVMVLDKSGSMRGSNLQQLIQAATNVILQLGQIDGSIGIIIFSTSATVTCPLMAVNNDQDKNKLIGCLPPEASGGTSIGSGILKGIELLLGSVGEQKPSGGHLIVMSDGQENANPRIKDVMSNITENDVVVTSISFGQSASKVLEDLAKSTGGSSYFASTNGTLTLMNAFTAIISNLVGPSSIKVTTPIQVYSREIYAKPGESFQDFVLVDPSVGDNSQFTFTWQLREVDVVLTSPSGNSYTSTSPEYIIYKQQKLVRIIIPKAENGRWEYTITDKTSKRRRAVRATGQSQSISITASASPKVENSSDDSLISTGVVIIEVRLSKEKIQYPSVPIVYVEVKLGHLAILNCSARVKVTVPNLSKDYFFQARDDGAGADIVANDGIYSAYMTNFDGNGRYALLGMADTNANQSYVDTDYIFGVGRAIDDRQVDTNATSSERQMEYLYAFSRVKSGPLLEVSNYQLDRDQLPPARVHDVIVAETISKNKSVILKWTAPGNDLDKGTAKGYEIRYSSTGLSIMNFRKNFTYGQIAVFQSVFAIPNATNATKPKPAGSTEQMIVTLDDAEYGNTYALGLIAYDDNMKSKVSNYVYTIFQHVFQPFDFHVKIDHHHLGIMIISWKIACNSCATGIAPIGYEIQYSTDQEDLSEEVIAGQIITQDQIIDHKTVTVDSSSDVLHEYTIKMRKYQYSRPYYFAVRGYDNYRYYSNYSNIADIEFYKVKSPQNLRVTFMSNASKEVQLQWILDSSKKGLTPARYQICWIEANQNRESCRAISSNLLLRAGEDFIYRFRFSEAQYGKIYDFRVRAIDIFYHISSASNSAKVELYYLSPPTDAVVNIVSHKAKIIDVHWKVLLNDFKISTNARYCKVIISNQPSLNNSSTILATEMAQIKNDGFKGYQEMSAIFQLMKTNGLNYAFVNCFDKYQLQSTLSDPIEFSFEKLHITTPYNLGLIVNSDKLTATLVWEMTKENAITVPAPYYEIRYSYDTEAFMKDFNRGKVVDDDIIIRPPEHVPFGKNHFVIIGVIGGVILIVVFALAIYLYKRRIGAI
ncbi:uncharacterized protein TRIADDRAFT_57572 [Trichoplax adhaerens]|uniref:VWFA domain-containing protein n=1 Tax=Trichoplax adhaerens TaxID=10228 RepID=B3RZT6_TRIAD|nr:hypothetical protein TRIADDRAFT_57572 [Trichoplax adhaerens]EDV23895.1 hypothetical protein TRIADDRAFT_57572 [Trichoplax adhaerens]|eukprot:XP_002113421.1 hypothetical protein TRIADDRAFT_57572 [Trichoplax adhaerens]